MEGPVMTPVTASVLESVVAPEAASVVKLPVLPEIGMFNIVPPLR